MTKKEEHLQKPQVINETKGGLTTRFWLESPEAPKTTQTFTMSGDCLPELDGQSLLLKRPHVLVAVHIEIQLEQR